MPGTGTSWESCPDHFIRTKIRPLFVPWDPQANLSGLREAIDRALKQYREEYAAYYASFAQSDSPKMRDANPPWCLCRALACSASAKQGGSTYHRRILYQRNTRHGGRERVGFGQHTGRCAAGWSAPRPRRSAFSPTMWPCHRLTHFESNTAARGSKNPPATSGKRIEPPDLPGRWRGKTAVGRETALLAADRGAHVVVADKRLCTAKAVASETQKISGQEAPSPWP